MRKLKNLEFIVAEKIGIIVIKRPKALNALNSALLRELDNLLDHIAEEPDIRVVIIHGSGEKAFVVGADITEMQNLSHIEGKEFGKLGQTVFDKIERLPQPVIAAVNGLALGSGCELAMACDIRIASTNAKFGQPEVLLGIIPGFGGTQRLPRLVGKGIAKELLFSGDQIDAQEAYRIGLVNRVVQPDDLMAETVTLAKKIISRATIAVQLCKQAVNEGMKVDLDSGLAHEAEVFGLCFTTNDQKEGMRAFIEKRQAVFRNK